MTGQKEHRLVIVSGGTSDPSATGLLAQRIGTQIRKLASTRGSTVRVHLLQLRELASEIATALVSPLIGPKLTAAIEQLNLADGIVAAAPVYKAGPSALFTGFFQVLDNDLLIAKPTVLAATAGTARHALVVDQQMRGLFAYLRTMTVPTSIFAATDDWSGSDLAERIDRAATEMILLMEAQFADQVKSNSWRSYQHEFGSAGGTETAIDLQSELMRLATGGSTLSAASGQSLPG